MSGLSQACTKRDHDVTRLGADSSARGRPREAGSRLCLFLNTTFPRSTMSNHADERQPLLGEEERHSTDPQGQSFSERFSSALREPKRLNGLEKALAAVAILLLLLTATGFGLFAGEATKLGRERRHRGGEGGDRPTATVTATSTVSAPTSTPTRHPKHPGKSVSLVVPRGVFSALTLTLPLSRLCSLGSRDSV